MNRDREILLGYVERKVERILMVKEDTLDYPLVVTDMEIMKEMREDVRECMRELHRGGRYQGTTTLNHPALKRRYKK